MSPEMRLDFEAEWPGLARRLRSFLARKKVPPAKQDDLIQETALRLYKMWASVDRRRPAWALTVTIALNLLRDEYRRAPHSDLVCDLPDIAQRYDLERAGLARIELGRVNAALAQMSPAHRQVLLAEVGQGGAEAGSGDKMKRMRARRKLTQILERVSAIVVLPARRLADVAHAVVGVREGLFAGASCVLCAILGIGVAVSVPLAPERAEASTIEADIRGESAGWAATSIMMTKAAAPAGSLADVPTAVRETTKDASVASGRGSPDEAPPVLPALPITADPGQEPPSIPLPGRDPNGGGPVPAPPPLPLPTEGPAGEVDQIVSEIGRRLTK